MQPRSRTAFCSLVGFACVALGAVPALVACEDSSSSSSGGPTPSGAGFGPGATATATATASPTMTAMPGTMPPPDGKSWGPAVEISSSTPSDLRGNPQGGIDGAGNAVAVWLEIMPDRSRTAVWASRYTSGAAWSAPATIDQPMGNAAPPALAITATGTAVAVFEQSTSNQGGAAGLQVNRFVGGVWSGPGVVSIAGQGPDRQAVALGPDGAATVVYQAADAMFPRAWAVRSTAAGVWGGPGAMGADTEPGSTPAVAVSANGDTVMTWTETGNGPSQTSLWASRSRAGVWGAPALLSTDTGPVEHAILVGADANGNTLALWSQRVGSIDTIRSTRLDATTGAWSPPVTVNDGLHQAIAPSLGLDADGDAVAVWAEAAGVLSSRFVTTTASWSPPVVVQGPGTGVSLTAQPTVGVDAKGNAVASWVQSVGSPPRPHLFAAHLAAASSTWGAPIDLVADPSAVPFPAETQLSVNAKGEAILVWHQETDVTHATGIWARVYR